MTRFRSVAAKIKEILLTVGQPAQIPIPPHLDPSVEAHNGVRAGSVPRIRPPMPGDAL
jgi:hypothetical protein